MRSLGLQESARCAVGVGGRQQAKEENCRLNIVKGSGPRSARVRGIWTCALKDRSGTGTYDGWTSSVLLDSWVGCFKGDKHGSTAEV